MTILKSKSVDSSDDNEQPAYTIVVTLVDLSHTHSNGKSDEKAACMVSAISNMNFAITGGDGPVGNTDETCTRGTRSDVVIAVCDHGCHSAGLESGSCVSHIPDHVSNESPPDTLHQGIIHYKNDGKAIGVISDEENMLITDQSSHKLHIDIDGLHQSCVSFHVGNGMIHTTTLCTGTYLPVLEKESCSTNNNVQSYIANPIDKLLPAAQGHACHEGGIAFAEGALPATDGAMVTDGKGNTTHINVIGEPNTNAFAGMYEAKVAKVNYSPANDGCTINLDGLDCNHQDTAMGSESRDNMKACHTGCSMGGMTEEVKFAGYLTLKNNPGEGTQAMSIHQNDVHSTANDECIDIHDYPQFLNKVGTKFNQNMAYSSKNNTITHLNSIMGEPAADSPFEKHNAWAMVLGHENAIGNPGGSSDPLVVPIMEKDANVHTDLTEMKKGSTHILHLDIAPHNKK